MEILQAYAHEFVQKAIRLGLSQQKLEDDYIWDDVEHREMLTHQLQELSDMCDKAELPVTKIKVDHVLFGFTGSNSTMHPCSRG